MAFIVIEAEIKLFHGKVTFENILHQTLIFQDQ